MVIRKYFASTFQSSKHVQREVTNVPPIDRVATSVLNIPISEVEVLTALMKLKRNKAVGVDGIPAEFYIPSKSDKGDFPFPLLLTTQCRLVPTITRLFKRILSDNHMVNVQIVSLLPAPLSPNDPSLSMIAIEGLRLDQSYPKSSLWF